MPKNLDRMGTMQTITDPTPFDIAYAANSAPSFIDPNGIVMCRNCVHDNVIQFGLDATSPETLTRTFKAKGLTAFKPGEGDDWCSVCDADIEWTVEDECRFSHYVK